MRTRKTKTSIEKQRDNYFNKLTRQIFRELVNRYIQRMTALGRIEEIKFRTKLCESLEIPYEVFRNIYDRGIGQINYILLTIEKCNSLGVEISDIFSSQNFKKLGREATNEVENQVIVLDSIIIPEL
jgi:hypothetical protein